MTGGGKRRIILVFPSRFLSARSREMFKLYIASL